MCDCLAEFKEKIENAPVAFDFFGPYISRTKLFEFLEVSGKPVGVEGIDDDAS